MSVLMATLRRHADGAARRATAMMRRVEATITNAQDKLHDDQLAAWSKGEVRALQLKSRLATQEVRHESLRARRTLRDIQKVILQTGEEIGRVLDDRTD